jgi:hypothetical protein
LPWLSTDPVEVSTQVVKAEVDKLGFLRGIGADRLDMSVLPAERRRFLATMGRRLTPQALERREPQRRYPILLTVLAQSATARAATRTRPLTCSPPNNGRRSAASSAAWSASPPIPARGWPR